MPVPKRKTSKSRRDKRQANKGIEPKAFTLCSNCSEPVMPHIVCNTCGFYRGKKIMATKLDRSIRRRTQQHEHAQKLQQKAAASEAKEPAEESSKK